MGLKLGVQTCKFCGAIIEVTKQDGWAFTPPHDQPERKLRDSENMG